MGKPQFPCASHYAIFAQSLHALQTAGLKAGFSPGNKCQQDVSAAAKGCMAQVHAPPCSWTLHAAAFESEWLARWKTELD